MFLVIATDLTFAKDGAVGKALKLKKKKVFLEEWKLNNEMIYYLGLQSESLCLIC